MAEPAKLRQVASLTETRSDNVIKLLEELLEQAKAGEVRAVAVAVELTDGTGQYQCAFGAWSHRVAMVGQLHVLAQRIMLNDILEWKPY